MTDNMRRGAREGLGFGIIAGIILAIAEIIASAAMADAPLAPLRLFASVILGASALDVTTSAGTAIVVGTIVHLVLSGAFGALYGFLNGRLKVDTQTNWSKQAGVGMLFGAGLWFVNFQIIARVLYPWFLTTPQFAQLVMHAVFYGLPLALMYASAERRVHHIGPAPTGV